MAKIVLGIGTSHTPMLNAPASDWGRFIELDRLRPHRDKAGRPLSYAALEKQAPPGLAAELTPEAFARKQQQALAHMERLAAVVRNARLDTLIVVGDDQKELYHDDNMPSILLYRGASIRNVPMHPRPNSPQWARDASSRYYERETPRDYPCDADLANHLLRELLERDFDLATADHIVEGHGEGHAFGFVHNRLLAAQELPIVPFFLNTYFPPNQPTPARCYKLGQAIRAAVESFPGDKRVGVLASGGLSHFTVDEDLDGRVIAALKSKDAAAFAAIPRAQLESGSSEIRNWICMAGAVEQLALRQIDYIPGYRTPAGTGTGLCFADWS
jgi:3-O-methylgallate 3,4-dioxygenase